MNSSVFLSCLVKLEEFANRRHLDIDEVCSWMNVGACVAYELPGSIIPPYVYDIRSSEPFINLSLEDEKLVYDLIPIILS